jgi:hypothetical protein
VASQLTGVFNPERESPRRPRISKIQRRLIWEYLDATFGHRCYSEGCPRQDLQIDHKDGNRANTTLANCQPACPVHQQVRQTPYRAKESEREKRTLSPAATAIVRNLLIQRDGAICQKCHAPGTDFHIHHLDGNPLNNQPENLILLHTSCHIGLGKTDSLTMLSSRVRVSQVTPGTDAIDPTDNLVSLSEGMMARVEDWLMKKLGPGGPHYYLPTKLVEKEASYDCKVSPVTIHRYIVNPGPLTASNARWRLVDRHLAADRPEKTTQCVTWRARALQDRELAPEAVKS